MDLLQPSPERSPASKTPSHRSKLRFAAAVIVALLLLGLALFVPNSGNKRLVWLSPAEGARLSQPGPFVKVEQAAMKWLGPLWRRIRGRQPTVQTSCWLMEGPADTSRTSALGASTTNTNGVSAWILTPSELAAFESREDNDADFRVLSTSRFYGSSGGQATIFAGPGYGATFSGSSGPTSPTPVSLPLFALPRDGLKVSVTFKADRTSVRLLLNATRTESGARSAANATGLVTNYPFACRVQVPDGGAAVLAIPKSADSAASYYWLVISPGL